MNMNSTMTTKTNVDQLIVWEVTDASGKVVEQSLDHTSAKVAARVFKRHLGGKFKVRARAFAAGEVVATNLATRGRGLAEMSARN